MPARVTIQSGISAGTTHWIERPVVRIGNDPKSDICLPSADVAAHALTLEFRDGQYRIYNRSRNDVFVGICVVAPGQAAAWFDTDILQLNKEIALVLDVDDDPTPMPVRRAGGQIDDDGAYDSELEEADDDLAPMAANQSGVGETKSDGSKFLVQLAVTVLCFAGCVGLLVRESMKGDMDGAYRKAPSFASVIREARAANTSTALVQRLQFAESAATRGNRKSARQRFVSLRDDLLDLQEPLFNDSRESELAILDFVEYRLGQLE